MRLSIQLSSLPANSSNVSRRGRPLEALLYVQEFSSYASEVNFISLIHSKGAATSSEFCNLLNPLDTSNNTEGLGCS